MNGKKIAVVLAAALAMTALTGCSEAAPDSLRDEAILLLMEREMIRRDGRLPDVFVAYHAEQAAEALEELAPEYSGIVKEIGKYIPEVEDYLSQADDLAHDFGDVLSQAQDVLSQVDELTSGAGRDFIKDLLSEAEQIQDEDFEEEADSACDEASDELQDDELPDAPMPELD